MAIYKTMTISGYHQSRYSYMTEEEVLEVSRQFDAHKIPLDVIWLDIDYTNGYKYFTWNTKNFSNPIELQASLSASGRKLVSIIDPHIKVDQEYFVYSEAEQQSYFLKYANGSHFFGECWPGNSSWIDFLNPEAFQFYAGLYNVSRFNGSTDDLYIWNDMNEPSVFNVPQFENTAPGELVHYGGIKHRDVHNIYGALQTAATYQ